MWSEQIHLSITKVIDVPIIYINNVDQADKRSMLIYKLRRLDFFTQYMYSYCGFPVVVMVVSI